MTEEVAPGAALWSQALLAAALFAVDPPACGGLAVRARSGPVRDIWLAWVGRLLPPASPVQKLPLNVGDDRLLGGLDLAATLKLGRPVAERGLLAAADQGIVILPSAERLVAGISARVGAAMDRGSVARERDGFANSTPARFGVIALDEGCDRDEQAPASLLDRLAFRVDLDQIALADASMPDDLIDRVTAARMGVQTVQVPDDVVDALAAAAYQLGIASARAPLLALQVARASAAFEGRTEVNVEDAERAAQFVLAPRATRLPAPDDQEPEARPPPEPEEPSPQAGNDTEKDQDGPLDDSVLAAAAAAIPDKLLAMLLAEFSARTRSGSSGRAGAAQKSTLRGRPAGVHRGDPRAGKRLNVVETLRAAAPWQVIRRREMPGGAQGLRVQVRRDDFRITRYKNRTETTAIFAVDASGSAALHRLAEAKGAIELLLADCYVRRDSVALISFRGKTAELLLPPTRSLVRAKRSLAGLPGGGGTPLAAGVEAAVALADAVRRKGQTPSVIFLTDGKANVARDGTGGRDRAEADALAAAGVLRALGVKTMLIDTSPRVQPQAERLARAMAAVYLPLPYADARTLSNLVQSVIADGA